MLIYFAQCHVTFNYTQYAVMYVYFDVFFNCKCSTNRENIKRNYCIRWRCNNSPLFNNKLQLKKKTLFDRLNHQKHKCTRVSIHLEKKTVDGISVGHIFFKFNTLACGVCNFIHCTKIHSFKIYLQLFYVRYKEKSPIECQWNNKRFYH